MTNVQYTQEDIDQGVPNSSTKCAGVLALQRAFPNWHRIVVTREKISYSDPDTDERITLATPPGFRRLVDQFDGDGAEVEPGGFDLDTDTVISRKPRGRASGRRAHTAPDPDRVPSTRAPWSFRPSVDS